MIFLRGGGGGLALALAPSGKDKNIGIRRKLTLTYLRAYYSIFCFRSAMLRSMLFRSISTSETSQSDVISRKSQTWRQISEREKTRGWKGWMKHTLDVALSEERGPILAAFSLL